MYVLRTGRELVAERLGVDRAEVEPSTDLAGEGEAVLAALLGKVEEALADEQGIDAPPAVARRSLGDRLARVGLPSPDGGAETVADVAETATRFAVRLLVADRLDVPGDELSAELGFAVDLGADSLTRVDLVLLLEEALEVSVPDDSMSLVQTVGDSELFAVLYDRTREGLVEAFGEPAERLAFNTPLSGLGDEGCAVALDAASRASGMALPERTCSTLQDAVRVAFLARRLRAALASATGADPVDILAETMLEEDLGLTGKEAAEAVRRLAGAMEIELSGDVHPEQLRTVACAVAALTAPPCGVGEDVPR